MVSDMAKDVKLTTEQQEAVDELDRHLQIIACAGSGKTEVISRRIANILRSKPDIEPGNIVAFTFTEKAAVSLKERIAEAVGEQFESIDQMYVGTIHGYCYHLLKRYSDRFREHKILDTVKSHLFVTRYCKECGMNDLELDPYPCNVSLFLQCIEKMIDDYDHKDTWTDTQRMVLDKYIGCVYDHGYLDFALLVFEVLRQIRDNPVVREELKAIRYLVVDEYQDVDDLQEKLIRCFAEAGSNVCVVGDDDQTIYQFRGSNAGNMISFSERYPNVHQVRLEKNFRCAPGIIDLADKVISHNERRLIKRMVSPFGTSNAEIRASRYADREEQFQAIAEQIRKLHAQGIPYGEMAILVRKGKVIAPAAASLERSGIPVETNSAESFFAGNYFNRFVITLQILSEVDKAKLYECWSDIVDDVAFNSAFKYLRSCARGGNMRLPDIMAEFCNRISFLNGDVEDIEERQSALDGITKILSDYDEIYGDWQLSARITGVLKFLGTQAATEYKYHNFKPKLTDGDAVHIMTVHKAKGLEFHTVFVPELTKREFPVSNMGGKKYWHVLGGVFEGNKDKYQSDLEDERKLFYVAVTRAKSNLFLTYELSSQPVSCFVAEAAESKYLQIDRSDLRYVPKDDLDDERELQREERQREREAEWEAERQARRAYWQAVKYARRQLYDYYGTASHFCPGAFGDLTRISAMSPDQILAEASANRLI